MKTALLLLLLGGFLCGLHGAEENEGTPDLLSMITKLQTEVQALKNQDQSLQRKVQTLQSEVQSLKNQNLENSQAQLQNPHVAFYAGLYTDGEEGKYGPFINMTTIKYKKVLTNVGGGYSADTGKFTAPLKGTYVFALVMFARNNIMATLRRNTETLAWIYDKSDTGTQDSSTAVAVVTLEAGDTAYVQLMAERHFYGFEGLFNSFSGFLLFPM